MNRRMKIMVSALAIVFGGIILFHLIKGFLIKRFFAHFEAPAVSVSATAAELKNWQPHINTIGNFVAINGVEVNAETAGTVVKIHFNSGQTIEKNAPLIDMNDSIEQANLKFSQADKVLKALSYKRQTELLKHGATSGSQLDEAKASLEQAEAQVEKIQAQIQQKHIRAPFSGQLGIRQVNLGQYLTPGQSRIVTLQSLDPLFLEFHVPEQLLPVLHRNQKIHFQVEAFPKEMFEGKITAVNSKVQPKSHNILLQATLANPHNQFLPGMFADIAIELPPLPNVVVVPSTAISYSLYGDTVYVIEKGRAKRRSIVKGEQAGNETVILKGIKAHEMVVNSGEVKLQDGTAVVINNSIVLSKK